jgi:hypothetical protein
VQEYYYFNRPLPPPRPTAHLWLGVILSGLGLGLGAFYLAELRTPRPVQLVTLNIDLHKGAGSPQSAEIQNLLTDVKELMGALHETQHALADAQTRIAALEQENHALREAGAQAAAPAAPNSPSAAAPEEGVGGPLVRAPEPDALPIAAPQTERRGGPKACWMRAGTMIATYRVAIRDDGFSLAPAWDDGSEGAWPAEFNSVMDGFRGTPLTTQAQLSRADFKKAMRPYFNYGMKQEARCRFLVSVTNETSSQEAWASGLALVERYFFKKVRGGRGETLAMRADDK